MPSPTRSLNVALFGPTSAWAPAATRKTAPAAATAAHPIARRLNALMLLPLFVAPRAGRWTVGPAGPRRTYTGVMTQVNKLLSTDGLKEIQNRPQAFGVLPNK